MAVSKTRQKLIDVARQLFGQQGLEATTMNEIAAASQHGRRTLYTYFKNKEEIFYAVIESELDRLTEKMRQVGERDMHAEAKVVELIFTHLQMIKEVVCRNGNLRAEFFRNIWMVERVRKNFDRQEIEIFERVLQQGVREGLFEIESVDLTAKITHYCVKGLEVPFIYGRLGEGLTERTSRPLVERLVHRALARRSNVY